MSKLCIEGMRGLGRVSTGLAAVGLCALFAFCLPFGEDYRQVASASPFLFKDTQLSLCALNAFLIAGTSFVLLMRRSSGSKAAMALMGAASALSGCLLAPLCAAFPPVALLLCRINCPERLYFPRPYSLAESRKRKLPVAAEDLLSMLEVCLVDCVFLSEYSFQIQAQGADGAVMWPLFGGLAIVLIYIWRVSGLRGSVAKSAKVSNTVFRCAWYVGWLLVALIALFSYLPAVIIS